MSKTKYITSGGLAFSEERDMEKLRRYSLKGWHVRNFKFMGYTLEKGESNDYIYSVDYRSLNKNEEEEYYELFSSSGWSHVDSQGDIHLFRAIPGTNPIYTDLESTVEKYSNLSTTMKKIGIPLILITLLLWVATMVSSGTLKSILLVIAPILSIIAVPTAWTLIATYNNKWKFEDKKGLVNLLKTILILLIFISVILFFVNNPDNAVQQLAYILIGSVALPTTIWIIMSVYHKIARFD